MVEMQVDSLNYDHKQRGPVIFLREYFGDNRVLAIPVGSLEGMSLSLVLNKEILPKPLTHDLILLCLRTLKAKFAHAEIASFSNGIFETYIVISQKQKGFRLEARPSDAITLAVRSGQPIYVSEIVFKQVEEAKESKTQNLMVPNPSTDAASDMVRRISAQHIVEMMSASRHHDDGPININELCEEQLLELLRCLEPQNRLKM